MNVFAEGVLRPAADGSMRLIAGRHKRDGRMRFPLPQGPEADLYEVVELPSDGTLWSFTVQRFRPKSPPYVAADADEFRPFAVGYVELPGQLIVETRIECQSFDQLRIGMPMRQYTASFSASDGREGAIYVFRPVLSN